jgi:hypothetical protein
VAELQALLARADRLGARVKLESYPHDEGRSGFVSISKSKRDGLRAREHWAITEEFEGDEAAAAVTAVLDRLESNQGGGEA